MFELQFLEYFARNVNLLCFNGRSVHHNLRLMLVGHRAANREFLFFKISKIVDESVALRLEWFCNFYLSMSGKLAKISNSYAP